MKKSRFPPTMNVAKFLKSKQAKHYQAIIKMVEGRRFLLGFERKNKASRLYRVKLMCPFPINLDQVVADYEHTKAKLEAQSSGGATVQPDDAVAAVGETHMADGE